MPRFAGWLGRMLGRVLSGRAGLLLSLGVLGSSLGCPVAEYPGEVLDGVDLVVGSVMRGIGGVLWYPVWGLMGFWLGG